MNIPFYEIKQSDIVVKKLERALLFPAHIHDEIELIYVLNGKQKVKVGDKIYEVDEGNALLILPEESHEYIREKNVGKDNRDAETIIVICNTKIFNGIFPDFHKYKAQTPIVTSEKLHTKAKEAFVNIFENRNESIAVYGWICVALYYIMKSVTIEKVNNIGTEGTVAKIMNYIADNFTEDITLETIAEHFHLSKYYISHIFSEKLKVNFRGYIGMLRAEYAAKLIRTTDNTMTEISAISGFDTQRTFNRVFSKIYGMTPTQYKKNISGYKG